MAGQTDEGGERRRALNAERSGSARRAASHAAPVPTAPDLFAAQPFAADPLAVDPFTTPASGAPVVRTAAGALSGAPTPPLGTPLPSRRDRAALRRPTVLDEAAVQASDSAAWRTSPALEDPRTASAISRPSPLTHALARTLTEHLESLTPPAGLSSAPSSSTSSSPVSSSVSVSSPAWSTGAGSGAASAYVPRRRPAPAVSGPLPAVGTTTTPAAARREPSWTTEPVASRRTLRPEAASPFDSSPLAPGPVTPSPYGAAPATPRWPDSQGEPDLPPPPPAAEVEAALRERAARFSTAPVPPPMPDRVEAEPPGRTSVVVPAPPASGPVSSGLASSGLASSGLPPVSGPTTALTAADLAVLRAVTTGIPSLGEATGATSTTALPSEPRHGRTRGTGATRASGRVTRPARAAGRPGRTPDDTAAGPATTTSTTTSAPTTGAATGGSTRPPSRPGARTAAGGRRWHQRRALGLPVGLLTATVALAAVVVVGTWSGAPGHDQITAALTSGLTSGTPGTATPPAATPAGTGATPADGTSRAAEGDGEQGGEKAAAAPAAGAGQEGSSSQAASQPASSAPASPRTAPLGDVTYEGFGDAKNTYVELGTKDAREEHQDLGATFTRTMPGSQGWPGWYVAVSNNEGSGSVGCRIKDADGTVLAEETSSTPGQPAMCVLGVPAGMG